MPISTHDDDRLEAGAEHWVAQAAVGGLDAAARLVWAGLALALVNLLLAGTLSPAGRVYLVLGIVAAALGAVQLWLLIRVAIDRRLFGALAEASALAGMAASLASLDQALAGLGWGRPVAGGRSLARRARGALRFLHWAAALAALQLLAALLLLLLR
ncbi:hypothetical protein P3W85_06310 [Cupriavidus basilensis]|uniref:Transmembrane protein n=1 Tax=Cupriavidus basilensis TaxID=68895 RepID=A0ABT6AIY1_9BURK|nr:hypothetical protein [Cupriavidus basilensis]MDF3832560.1 hypothetical protein [Cupriavidus basilensis]